MDTEFIQEQAGYHSLDVDVGTIDGDTGTIYKVETKVYDDNGYPEERFSFLMGDEISNLPSTTQLDDLLIEMKQQVERYGV